MILLSIGSNLNSTFGDRFANIRKSIDFLKIEKIKIKKISNFFETPSYPNNNFPRFINIAVSIECNFKPELLLQKICMIDKKMERVKTVKNEPRTCDIDIIDFNGVVLSSNNLNLPHPNAHERNFVLYPLLEVAPQWVHPISNKKIDILIKNLTFRSSNEITRLDESVMLNK